MMGYSECGNLLGLAPTLAGAHQLRGRNYALGVPAALRALHSQVLSQVL
jgi:hypothetical protein